MRSIKNSIVAVTVAMLLSTGAFAGADLNEVGALLVYPVIMAAPGTHTADAADNVLGGLETFVTITNAGADDVMLHVSYINGEAFRAAAPVGVNGDYREPNPQYCYECDFEIPMSGNDTETLVITNLGDGTRILAEDLYLDMSCPWRYGMLVVSLEDAELGMTITDNVLLGEEVVVDYGSGAAFSIPAIPFQGKDGGDGDRTFDFDDNEYAKLPRIVAADFLAPDVDKSGIAHLALFTLGFERQFPPLVDCSVIGFDANEHPFSGSFQFGCWSVWDLCEISPEFCYPNLGLFNNDPHHPINDTHGWLQLNCRVDTNPNAADGFETDGGVHGAIIQTQRQGSILPAGSAVPIQTAAQWGRLLYQSVTTGDAVQLILENPAGGMD
jgi:hypothetical protein